jgi:hypothetical protein
MVILQTGTMHVPRKAGCVEALLLAGEAHRAALLPASALPYALAALHHARRLSLDLLAARAVVAVADVRLALGLPPLALAREGKVHASEQKCPVLHSAMPSRSL